jgi:hypothetical protein
MTTYKDEVTGERLAIKGKDQRVNVSARQNKPSTTTTVVTLNAATATTIVTANSDRVYLSITFAPGITDIDAFIRYYPAATDNLKQGADILSRRLLGADNLFRSSHIMETNAIYTGEVSAIMNSGSVDVTITEY